MTMEVSAEVHFAQTLASNDKKFRDRALKRLKKYINVRSCNGEGLSHDDFIKLWKGLHYCMWMQDKPIIQEELSQKMVSLLHAFPNLHDVIRFVHVFFITEAREWTGIDRLRLDKFMLLIREMLHETFVLLSRDGWPLSECQSFSQNLTAVIMNEDTVKVPYGIKTHLADIFLVELKKVSFDGMNAKKFTILMFPFIYFILKTKRRDLAQTVYESTLSIALVEFGTWSWQGDGSVNNSGDKAKIQQAEQTKEEGMECAMLEEEEEEDDDDDSDGDGDEEETEEEEEDGDVEEESEEDSDMEVEENADTPPVVKFDLSTLLRLLHKLALDPKVEIRNRRFAYGIVNAYASKDPTVLQSPPMNGKGHEDDQGDLNIAHVYQLTGETMKEDSDNKKRRRRNRKRRREEGEGIGQTRLDTQESAGDNNTVVTKPVGGEDQTNASQPKKFSDRVLVEKKKKKKKGNDEEEGKENNIIVQSPKRSVNGESKKEKGSKKMEDEPLLKNASTKSSGKKRKRMSNEGEENISISNNISCKKLKVTLDDSKDDQSLLEKSPISTTPKTTNKQKHKRASWVIEEDTNANSNARGTSPNDKMKGKSMNKFISPVECVVYKQKSPKARPSTINKLVTSITSPCSATTTFSVADSSPVRSRRNIDPNALSASATVPPPEGSVVSTDSGDEMLITAPDRTAQTIGSAGKVGNRSPSASRKSPSHATQTSPKLSSAKRKARKSEEATTSEDSSVMSSLYNMISTPCSMIKRAVGMVAPATDPGTSREKTVTLPEQLTPGGQKKVVFDLRRNKANKFQDYLKTLASEPSSPAFEPSKSPSHSILKSPSTESFPSSASSTSVTKRKKGKDSSVKRKSLSPRGGLY